MDDFAARDVIGTYLEEVGCCLPGSGGDRRDVLDELYDGLLEATAANARDGMRGEEAAAAAAAQFGPPGLVARAYAPELLLTQIRRSAWRVVLLLLVGGLAWQACRMLMGSHLDALVPASGWQRAVFLAGVDTIRVLPAFIQGFAVVLLGVARLNARWPRAGWRLVRWLAGLVGVMMTLMVASGAALVATGVSASMLLWLGWMVPSAALLGWAVLESVRGARSARALARAPVRLT